MTLYNFSQLVINWYHQYGRKNLPWQKSKTLYKVWISEIMLQQTKVKTVIPYFKKFIKKFPNIYKLYNSNIDEILYLWSGLGYYKRAENIYKTAKIIQKNYQSEFPKEFSNIIKLPGIGKSTAGSILSLTLNYSFPILEGNIKRILIRYYNIIESLTISKIEKKLWNIINSITPIHNAGHFNQGMMDIGSLICTKNNPKCNICPLSQKCIAYKNKLWNFKIFKKVKQIKLKKHFWFLIIKYKNKFWIEKNIKKNIWHNLFCFPYFSSKEKLIKWLKKNSIDYTNITNKIKPFYHKFSHFTLYIIPNIIELPIYTKIFNKNNLGIWYNLKKPNHIGFPKPVERILNIYK